MKEKEGHMLDTGKYCSFSFIIFFIYFIYFIFVFLRVYSAKDLNKTQMLQMIEFENFRTQQLRAFEQKQAELTKKYRIYMYY